MAPLPQATIFSTTQTWRIELEKSVCTWEVAWYGSDLEYMSGQRLFGDLMDA